MPRFIRPPVLTLIALLVAAPFDTRVAAQTSQCFRFEQRRRSDVPSFLARDLCHRNG